MVESTQQIEEKNQLQEKKEVADTLTFGEADVGIELFYSDTLPKEKQLKELAKIECAFKHRFSDFVVNEIDQSGEVVWFKKEENLQKESTKMLALAGTTHKVDSCLKFCLTQRGLN